MEEEEFTALGVTAPRGGLHLPSSIFHPRLHNYAAIFRITCAVIGLEVPPASPLRLIQRATMTTSFPPSAELKSMVYAFLVARPSNRHCSRSSGTAAPAEGST